MVIAEARGPATEVSCAALPSGFAIKPRKLRFGNGTANGYERADFEDVLRLEFGPAIADPWLAAHPSGLGLSYGYVLFRCPRVVGPGPVV